MKIHLLIVLILFIAFAFAQDSGDFGTTEADERRPYPCGYGGSHCDYGKVCYNDHGDCKCIPDKDCKDVTLNIKFIGRWTDGERGDRVFSQYDVIVTNHSHRTVKNVYIGTGYGFRLRDRNSIWNANVLPYGVLSLAQSINSGASFTFGFIIYGDRTPNLRILAVTY